MERDYENSYIEKKKRRNWCYSLVCFETKTIIPQMEKYNNEKNTNTIGQILFPKMENEIQDTIFTKTVESIKFKRNSNEIFQVLEN